MPPLSWLPIKFFPCKFILVFDSNRHDRITQNANARYFNLHRIALLQSESIGRHNPRPREQHGAVGKSLAAEEKPGQLVKGALNLPHRGLAGKDGAALPLDL